MQDECRNGADIFDAQQIMPEDARAARRSANTHAKSGVSITVSYYAHRAGALPRMQEPQQLRAPPLPVVLYDVDDARRPS